ncbi:hypothetical protein [Flavobacterium lipolyticum]|uniref:Uncharacterized protein n=1 Tax=Flavobacterium lipolyticum TaxID=2893754 RepID=A0ABS8LYE3_9FLAO|nr:hypothetical protein [Flavobacterium sp. F-126]MCC9016958.1 hypothetical protein [Flavobacterium sp. F-126]
MVKNEIIEKLIEIKNNLGKLGLEYLETQMPVALSDVGLTLRPFTGIDTAINSALKKLSEENTGSIPKANNLNRE